jgi:hypothetical protein
VTLLSKIRLFPILTGMLSLLLGAATVLWADFGMPGWFFVLGQIWFWTLGLPAMIGVLAVTAVWGIHGWTALPAWLYLPCVALAAVAFQYASFLIAGGLWRRLTGRRP